MEVLENVKTNLNKNLARSHFFNIKWNRTRSLLLQIECKSYLTSCQSLVKSQQNWFHT